MQSLTEKLTTLVGEAFAACGFERAYGEVVPSSRPDLGQFQSNGALTAARVYDVPPRQIAQRVVDNLTDPQTFSHVTVAGPGFINLTLSDAFLVAHVEAMAAEERLGCEQAAAPCKIVIDYGGPNVAKPLHVGHLRAAIIGESLKRLARFLGHEVVGDVHLGDWGLQMGMLISELERRQPNLPYFDAGYTGPYPAAPSISLADLEEMYPAASQRAQTDPIAMETARQATYELQQGRPGYRALWQHFVALSVSDLKADYDRLNAAFDLWLGESDTQDRIPALIERLLAQGDARQSEGAIVVDISRPDDAHELPPLMLAKSDGAALYSTTDLATIEQRVTALEADLILYVVDNRQSDHFRQVFRAAYQTGIAPASVRLEHIGFGTMNGPDGRPFKTRAGGVMKLKDLLDMVTEKAVERMADAKVAVDCDEKEKAAIAQRVGVAALKYADLMNHRTRDYVFDLERFSSFEGRTGPYLLYTIVRARSILNKSAGEGLAPGPLLAPASGEERDVLLQLGQYQDALALAWTARSLHPLCDYVYDLAVAFNRFYHRHHILHETDRAQQASWLALVHVSVAVLMQILDLLGIRVPDQM